MADTAEKPNFDYNDKELAEKISQYKQDLLDDKFDRASWPHFCAFLGYTEREVADTMRYGDRPDREANVYTRRSRQLKRMLTWIRGQMLSGKGWSGQNQSKAIFALKQDMGDNVSYTDQATTSGPANIKISFGGEDKRSKKAAK